MSLENLKQEMEATYSAYITAEKAYITAETAYQTAVEQKRIDDDNKRYQKYLTQQRNMLLTIITISEQFITSGYLEQYIDSSLLTGITQEFRNNINDYDDIFKELYDKYNLHHVNRSFQYDNYNNYNSEFVILNLMSKVCQTILMYCLTKTWRRNISSFFPGTEPESSMQNDNTSNDDDDSDDKSDYNSDDGNEDDTQPDYTEIKFQIPFQILDIPINLNMNTMDISQQLTKLFEQNPEVLENAQNLITNWMKSMSNSNTSPLDEVINSYNKIHSEDSESDDFDLENKKNV